MKVGDLHKGIETGGYRAFYSRPPLFLVVTASSDDALAAKINEMDARLSKPVEPARGPGIYRAHDANPETWR